MSPECSLEQENVLIDGVRTMYRNTSFRNQDEQRPAYEILIDVIEAYGARHTGIVDHFEHGASGAEFEARKAALNSYTTAVDDFWPKLSVLSRYRP